MSPGTRTLSPWRWPLGVLLGTSAAALIGGACAAALAPQGERLAALLLGAGLVTPLGIAVSAASVAGMAFLLAANPAASIRDLKLKWSAGPPDAARFAVKAAAIGIAAIVWLTLAFHAVRLGRQAFHHMGLAALLVTGMLIASAAVFWLVGSAAARFAAPRLARRVPPKILAASAPLALLVAPALAAALYAAAPVSGEGAFGCLGLLKREELDLAFVWPLAAAALLAAVAAASVSRRAATPLAIILFAASGASAGGAISAGRAGPGNAAFAAVEANGGLASMSLGLLRRAADRDRDGASALFGGGDCDDADPGISPAAIDVPGNGVDEDCSGSDARRPPKLVAAPAPAAPAAERPKAWDALSVVLVTVDALRADIPCSGYARPITKSIDALARRGVAFENAYALSSFTGRAVGPMLIGRSPSEAFCNTEHFTRYYEKNELLAEALKAAGFATAGVQGHFYFERSGLQQGFDKWIVVDPPGGANADQKTTSQEIADEAVALLEDASFTKGRFFLWAHFMDPHKEYLEHPGFSVYGSSSRDRYDGEVAFTDHHVGRIIDAIEKAGLGGRTAIAVTADHGEAFNEHGTRFHGRFLWEEIVRVPWIWVAPGLQPRRVAARVSQIDLVATICDLLGVAAPSQSRGQSLVRYMTGAAAGDRRVFLDQPLGPYMPEAYAVIDGGSKLIHTAIGNRYELYDLGADPGEKHDLAASRPDELARMKTVYEETRGALEQNADKYRP